MLSMLHVFTLGLKLVTSHHVQLRGPQLGPTCPLLTNSSRLSGPTVLLLTHAQPGETAQEHSHRAACHGTYLCAVAGTPWGPQAMVPGGHTCLSAGGSPTGAPLEAVWAQATITPPLFTSERHWWSCHLHNLTAARAPTHGFPVGGGGCPSLTPGSACLQPLLIVAFLLEQHLRALPEPGSVGTNASGSTHKRSASDGIISFIHCTAGPGRGSHLKAMP